MSTTSGRSGQIEIAQNLICHLIGFHLAVNQLEFALRIDHECVAEMYENLNDAAYHIGQYANARIELFQLSLALRRSLQKQNHRKKQGIAS